MPAHGIPFIKGDRRRRHPDVSLASRTLRSKERLHLRPLRGDEDVKELFYDPWGISGRLAIYEKGLLGANVSNFVSNERGILRGVQRGVLMGAN